MKLSMVIIIFSSFLLVNTALAQSIRKDYNEMTSDEREAYVDALYELRTGVDVIEQLRSKHSQSAGQIHGVEIFLPWHRLFLLEFEEELQSVNSELTVPYWNWVTDNSASDPLWDQDFLGQFDDADVWENLDRDLSGPPSLPSGSQVSNVQGISSFSQYRVSLEGIHNDVHCWVDGIMCQVANSPLDPVFYFHHGFVDKLWQDWENENQSSSFSATSMPDYSDDPDNIVDSRTLNVWYAEDGEVLLDQYDTDGTEEYRYTGIINSKDDFVVKNGSDVTFIAGNKIVLGANFKAETGATFYAEVDTDVGNILAKTRGGIAEEPFEEPTDRPEAFSLSQNYPNPFNPVTVIRYQLPASSEVRLEVFDLLGRTVATLVDGQVSAGQHEVRFDASTLSSGVYIYRIRANNFVETRQMTLIK